MTDIFRNQLMRELQQAGFHGAQMTDDGQAIVPAPEYPHIHIVRTGVRYSEGATEEERDLGHDEILPIYHGASEATALWENSREMSEGCAVGEKFRLLSEFGDVVLAARDDGARGLHFVTWEYGPDRDSVHHGHYTTSFTGAKEDFAIRSGLVQEDQLIDPTHAPIIYRALQNLEQEYWLTAQCEDHITEIRDQLRQMDPDIAGKADGIAMSSAMDEVGHEHSPEQEMEM